jgi:hypothetical protein
MERGLAIRRNGEYEAFYIRNPGQVLGVVNRLWEGSGGIGRRWRRRRKRKREGERV